MGSIPGWPIVPGIPGLYPGGATAIAYIGGPAPECGYMALVGGTAPYLGTGGPPGAPGNAPPGAWKDISCVLSYSLVNLEVEWVEKWQVFPLALLRRHFVRYVRVVNNLRMRSSWRSIVVSCLCTCVDDVDGGNSGAVNGHRERRGSH